MKTTAAAVCVLALAVRDVAATAVARGAGVGALLRARQGSTINPGDIAPQCQTVCQTLVTIFNACQTDPTQCLSICTNTAMNSIAQCLDCTVSAGGPPSAADVAQAQQALSELEDDCAQSGSPVSSFTISASTVAVAPPATSGASTFSIPLASGSSQSIFFSSPGSTPSSPAAPPAASTSVGAAPTAVPPPISKSTVTALSTPAPGASSTAGDLNPTVTPTGGAQAGNGAGSVRVGGAAVVLGAALGAFALFL